VLDVVDFDGESGRLTTTEAVLAYLQARAAAGYRVQVAALPVRVLGGGVVVVASMWIGVGTRVNENGIGPLCFTPLERRGVVLTGDGSVGGRGHAHGRGPVRRPGRHRGRCGGMRQCWRPEVSDRWRPCPRGRDGC
jgi:hypothetical protein